MPSGGKRAGSGRKPAEPGSKRVQMMITIAPETREKLTEAAKRCGVSVGRIIDEMAETFHT